MIDSTALVAALKAQVLTLEDDLRARVDALPEVAERWRAEHRRVVTAERTALSWTEWRDDRVTQAAVAWALMTVFLRFCEDNALVAPVWIAGPVRRRQEALDAQLAFFRQHPLDTDREWLQEAVHHLASLPATAELVGRHAALRLVSPSGDAVSRLVSFWRQRTEDGLLVYDFTDPSLSTRFLGDLYQELSAYAKATFALLQTPVFVEEFILDRTLEPALADRPLESFRLIDPTCGSGHFLLGAFDRLLDRWQRQAPAMETQTLVQHALDAIHGVDLNPFAVAIARFRLTVAAMKACGLPSLESAPAFRFHLAAGDSLLHGPGQQTFVGDADLSGFTYETEDLKVLESILAGGRYDVVVGNPPYITVKDKVLNQAYRERYSSCKGTYALTVPFMERFFGLAKWGIGGQPAGWVGQITSNSFMKREFGSKLIEEFLVSKDLRLIVNSEGAWIPGHNMDGTPTVILIGRNQRPTGTTVRAVLSKGKREVRSDGAEGRGPYWSSMLRHLDQPVWDDAWITVTDLDRSLLSKHPWSLSGGGAVALLNAINLGGRRNLGEVIDGIGRVLNSVEDSVLMWERLPKRTAVAAYMRPVADGSRLRDYVCQRAEWVVYGYGGGEVLAEAPALDRYCWPYRASMRARLLFGRSIVERGLPAWSLLEHYRERANSSALIAFAMVASHNHFVLLRDEVLARHSAPTIKLRSGAVADDYLKVLGVLNSSVACFWLKEHSQPKGGAADHLWARTYEFTGTTLRDYPLPPSFPMKAARILDSLASELENQLPQNVTKWAVPTAAMLQSARADWQHLRRVMLAVQEDLDWDVYRLYGLISNDLTYHGADLPEVALGERAFEINLARQVATGHEQTAWFVQHGSTPITEVSAAWPADYAALVEQRLGLIASDPAIRLLEKPEYKRRWASESWEAMQQRALRDWLLDRLEDKRFWFSGPTPTPRSVSQLADAVGRDEDLVSVLALWEGRPDVSVVQSLTKLLTDEAVPFLAAYRLRDSGLRKFEAWQETWELQREEDAGKNVGTIPVPPKYTNADFRKPSWWQARGKLDVPKERFILYPDAGRSTDSTLLLGWAGWDHAEQALALALLIGEREAEGWPDERLVALIAGLAELQPWVEQWHADVHPVYGQSLAVFCREQLSDRSRQVNRSVEQLAAWRPPATTRGRKAKV